MATKNMTYNPYKGSVAEKIAIKKTFPVNDEFGNIKYIAYLLEKKLNDGSIVQFYKASAFFKLQRVSKETKENNKLMEIHTDIVRSLYATNINFIEIIANILKPNPVGLVFLYGVQSTGNSLEEAIRKCSGDFNALLKTFQGTHRTNHVGPCTKEDMQYVFKKLEEQKYVSVVKGIPSRRKDSGRHNNALVKADNSTEEQIEQFLVGAGETEFCLMLMATPVNKNYLIHWLTKSLDEESRWQRQKQGSTTLGMSVGIPMSISMNNSSGISSNRGSGLSSNQGISHTQGKSEGSSLSGSESFSESVSKSTSDSDSSSKSHSVGTSDSIGTSKNTSEGSSVSAGMEFFKTINASASKNESTSQGTSASSGTSTSDSDSSSQSHSESNSKSESNSYSNGWGTNKGTSESDGWNAGTGQSSNVSRGTTQGTSSGFSGGANFGFNMSKSYQWVDKTVEYICELLAMQNARLKTMTDGDGGFFVDMYLSTDTQQNQRALEAISQSTWVNPDSKIDVLRTETPDRASQKKLAMHMQAMSPCLEIVMDPDGGGGYYYKYSSVLCSSELASYCHPPRISIGGLDNSMEDIPVLRVPTNRQNKEIFIGNVITGERYSYEMACKHRGIGYMTDFKYTIGNDEMHHAFFSGASRSGKSVLASRAVLEMYTKAPYINPLTGEKRRKRVLVLDPKGEWRQMASMIPRGKFKFYSVGKSNFHPLRMNVLRVPKYVTPYNYYNLVVEHFCSAYGLMDRAVAQISSIIYDLYEKADVFGHDDDPFWANEHSKDITLEDVYKGIEAKLAEAQARRINHDAEALQTYLTRLDMYHRKHSNEYIMFCNRGGDSADILLGEDDFTVVESNGLSDASQRFFFILLMNSIYENALAQGPKGFYTNSYETVIVLEEANSILIAAGKDDTSGQKSINRFNQLIDKSASLGLFFWTITQKIASMPDSVIANSGIVFIGRTPQEQDIKVALATLGYDDRRDLEVKRFIPRLTTGCFLVKISKGEKFENQTPTCIKSAMLKTYIPDDQELEILIQEHELERVLNEEL